MATPSESTGVSRATPIARCGRTDPHGHHVFLETHGWRNGRKTWCLGNINPIIEGKESDAAH